MKKQIMRIFNKENKTTGIIIIVVVLILLMSAALGIMWNPIYLIEYFTLIPIFGEWGSLLIYMGVIAAAGYYYLEMKFALITKRRVLAFILFVISVFMFFLVIAMVNNHVYGGEYVSIVDWYNFYVSDMYWSHVANISSWGTIHFSIMNIGIILPLVFWVQGILGFAEWFGFLIWIPLILYFLYVLSFDDWQIYFGKLNPFGKEDDNINTVKKVEQIDLNLPTEEFEIKFSPEEREKMEIVEKVKKNMHKETYDELSNKIKLEREKLLSLREQVIKKVRDNNESVKKTSGISDELREKMDSTLGFTSYTRARMQSKSFSARKEEPVKFTSQTTIVKEEKIPENKVLIKDGYKTTEQITASKDPMLVDNYLESLMTNMEKTEELPMLANYYKDIYDEVEKVEEEIDKTLEMQIDFEEETNTEEELKEITAEFIIEDLQEDLTVEEYISIPEMIEKTEEKKIEFSLNQEEFTSPSKGEVYLERIDTLTEELSFNNSVLEDEIIDEGRPKDWCVPYTLPSTSILSKEASNFDEGQLFEDAENKSQILNMSFDAFGVKAMVDSFEIGPTITTFKVKLEPGIRVTKITNIEDNLKMNLGAEYIRILAPIPGTTFVGIEVPNLIKRPVSFRGVYDKTEDLGEGIMISIGQDVSGKAMSFDLTKAPHLLVAGSTGSGKSVGINTILASILLRYKPTDVQLILVDPKMVEFAPYHGIPHLLAEVITDASNANKALQAMVQEMEDRYLEMSKNGAKKIEELNEKLIARGENKKPYIVIVIDELADLMMVAAKEVEDSIMRITQKARAAGIHMILATQRPSTEIITGTIKSNIPSRMAFTVASSIDSRTILGQIGAEKLIGMGDMLVSLYGKLPIRGQGAYISNSEVDAIANATKKQCSAHYVVDIEEFSMANDFGGALFDTNDPLYQAAIDTVMHYKKASTSMLQRHLSIGYNKAANIIETMESEGIVGPSNGSKPREVLLLE